jgi:hypothetical protein
MSSQLGAAQLGDLQLGGLDDGSITLNPGAASLIFTGGSPVVSPILSPGPDTLVFTGGTPTVDLDFPTFDPGPDTLTFTGGTPTVSLSITLSPGPADITFFPQGASISLIRTVGTGDQLFIGSTQYEWVDTTFNITKVLSGAWSASFDLIHTGGTKPQRNEPVAMFVDSVKRFGGVVESITESAIKGSFTHSVLHVKCRGFQVYTDRRIIAKLFTLPIGAFSGIIVYEIWREYLAPTFGTSFDGNGNPLQFVGEQLFHYITVTEALNRMKAMTPGWDWWIDDNNKLHFEDTTPDSATAPFTLRNTDRNVDDMSVTEDVGQFANKAWVLPTVDLESLRTDSGTGDGTNQVFATQYILNVKPLVYVDGVQQIVAESLDTGSTPGYQVVYVDGGIGVLFVTAPPLGDVVEIKYPNPFPLAFYAEDQASIAAVGLFESIKQSKDSVSKEAAEEEAAADLEMYATNGNFPVRVFYTYNSHNQSAWLTPGMILDVDRTFPTALGLFTVEQVDSREESEESTGELFWRHSVTLRSNLGPVTNTQAIRTFQTAGRIWVNRPPTLATFEVAQDIPGFTNPGLATGVQPQYYRFRGSGVISSWDFIAVNDPPEGASIIIDMVLSPAATPEYANGTSIFPSGDANKIVIPDGDSSEQNGFRFVTDSISYADGDYLYLNVIQVGSTNPGSNLLGHLNLKPNTGVAPSS